MDDGGGEIEGRGVVGKGREVVLDNEVVARVIVSGHSLSRLCRRRGYGA